MTVRFGCICILAFGNNPGKKVSYWLTGVSFASIIAGNIIAFNPSEWLVAVSTLTEAILMLCVGIMIYFKYQDKEARGVKI